MSDWRVSVSATVSETAAEEGLTRLIMGRDKAMTMHGQCNARASCNLAILVIL